MSVQINHYNITPRGFVSLNQVRKDLEVSRPTINRWVRKVDNIFRITVNEVIYISTDDVQRIREARGS